MANKNTRPKYNYDGPEKKMASQIDRIAEFHEFEHNVLPALRKDISKGLSADELFKKYQSVAAGRILSMIASGDDAKAYQASKEALDRSQGKPTEKKEHTHKLEDLPEEELDALLYTELEDDEQDSSEKSE